MRMLASLLTRSLLSDDHIRPIFEGVYAIDKLPLRIPKERPAMYVINSDIAQNAGQHWFCVYFRGEGSRKTCEFWDSFGYHPSHYNNLLMDFIEHNSSDLLYNHRRLQSDSSAVCGHYCLFYSYFRARNFPMECILSKDNFVLDTGVNDLYVYNFCRKNFSICI